MFCRPVLPLESAWFNGCRCAYRCDDAEVRNQQREELECSGSHGGIWEPSEYRTSDSDATFDWSDCAACTGFFRLKAEVTGDKDEKFFLDIKPRFWLGRLG